MTARDYAKIAEVIREHQTRWNAHPDITQRTLESVANGLADMLAADNPRFNRALFLKACNLEDQA